MNIYLAIHKKLGSVLLEYINISLNRQTLCQIDNILQIQEFVRNCKHSLNSLTFLKIQTFSFKMRPFLKFVNVFRNLRPFFEVMDIFCHLLHVGTTLYLELIQITVLLGAILNCCSIICIRSLYSELSG